MQVLRTVTRCARQLFHEYQRQLWDDNIDELYTREVRDLCSLLSCLNSSLHPLTRCCSTLSAVRISLE